MPVSAWPLFETRRAFLRRAALCTGAALAAPALFGEQAAAGPPLACRLASYGKFQDAAWTHLPSIGVRFLFMNVPAPGEVAATQDRLAKSGLAALVMRGGADLAHPSSVDNLAAQLAICRQMGVRYMFLSPKHEKVSKEVAYERLRALGDVAKSQDVIVTLETHRDLGTNADVHRETMLALNHPNIRVNFDTGNITYYNKDRNAVDEMKKIIDFVGTVELKDHDGNYESWVFPPVGRGITDLKGVVAVLKEHGYAGPVTLEFEGVKGVELDEEGTKAAIAESIAYIRSLGTFT